MTTFEWAVVVELAFIGVGIWLIPSSSPIGAVVAATSERIGSAIISIVNSLDDINDVLEDIRDQRKTSSDQPSTPTPN